MDGERGQVIRLVQSRLEQCAREEQDEEPDQPVDREAWSHERDRRERCGETPDEDRARGREASEHRREDEWEDEPKRELQPDDEEVPPGDREDEQAEEREGGIAERHGRRHDFAERSEKAGPKEREGHDGECGSRDQRFAHVDVVRVCGIGADPADVARESTHHLPSSRQPAHVGPVR